MSDSLSDSAAVNIDDLHFFRGDREVLHDISLTIEPGTFLGIVGPNGGGKTTLCRLIMGILKPTQGRLSLFGRAVATAKRPGDGPTDHRRELVGYVPQRQSPPEGFPGRVIDIVLMAVARRLWSFRRIGKETRARALHCLEQVDLSAYVDHPIDALSGGQYQRVLMARALLGRPKILVLDEPLEGVDVDGRQRFMALVKTLIVEEGLTVLMVSHDIVHLVRFADRILCLNRTIHWHDQSERLDNEVLTDLYACEWKMLLADHHKHHEHLDTGHRIEH